MFRPQCLSVRHVFRPMVIFIHEMNLLIFSDSFANYALKSVGGSEGNALGLAGEKVWSHQLPIGIFCPWSIYRPGSGPMVFVLSDLCCPSMLCCFLKSLGDRFCQVARISISNWAPEMLFMFQFSILLLTKIEKVDNLASLLGYP